MRLIDADALERDMLEKGLYPVLVRRTLERQPTIDARPVVHGEWILGYVEPGYFTPGGNRPWICSNCGKVVSWCLDKPSEKFCSECGADMRGE